jgi:hypothetical protein
VLPTEGGEPEIEFNFQKGDGFDSEVEEEEKIPILDLRGITLIFFLTLSNTYNSSRTHADC